MTTAPTIRPIRVAAVSVACAVALIGGCLAPEATAASLRPTPSTAAAFNFDDDASYILDIRAGAAEVGTALPAALYQDFGYSETFLSHDIGQPAGSCDTSGGTYYLGQYLEEAVLGKGAAPPDAGDVEGGYHNPVTARDTKPENSVDGNLTDRRPGIVNPVPPGDVIVPIQGDGNPVRANAKCESDLKGSSAGALGDLGPARVMGSTTSAQVDRVSGLYTGTGRAYVSDLEGAGPLDTVSSFMQIVQKPNTEPTITYRLSIFSSKAGSENSLGANGFTLSGTNVPIDQLITQFNSQAQTLAAAAQALGPFGLQILAPRVGTQPSTDTGTTGLRFVQSPVIYASVGSHLRDGTLGEHEEPSLGSVTFTGVYGQR